MTGPARRWRVPARWTAAVPIAVALSIVVVASTCGSTDGTAIPTAPSQTAASTTVAPVVTGPPLARFDGFSSPFHSQGDTWLCGPGAAVEDRCLNSNQDTTVVAADGDTEVRVSEPAPRPAFDCFYVYPDATLPSGGIVTAPDLTLESTVVFQQVARLREQCRVYAPLFRRPADGGGYYADVLDSFKHYMARWNGRRPLVLVGHGQGADHLLRLLEEEFDGDADLRSLLVSAFLVGGHVDATGPRTVGRLRSIPTCSSPSERGCVVGWTTSSPDTPRDVAAAWGEAPAGRSRLCMNPAALAGGSAALTPIVEYRQEHLRQPVDVATPFLELPGALTAECVTQGSVTTLVVRPAGDAGTDVRNADALTEGAEVWGLHAADIPLTLGSMMQLIQSQTADLG